MPDELRRHRRHRHGAPRPGRRPDGAPAGRGGLRRRRARWSPCRRCASPGIYLALATAAFAVFLDRWVFLLPAVRRSARGRSSSSSCGVVAGRAARRARRRHDRAASAARGAGGASFALAVPARRRRAAQRLRPAPARHEGQPGRLRHARHRRHPPEARRCSRCRRRWPASAARSTPARSARSSAERFSFFESLPLLLLAVVGGIGTAAGALFAGVHPRRLPDRHRHLAVPRQPQPGPARHDGHRARPQPERRGARHRAAATACSARCRSPWSGWSARRLAVVRARRGRTPSPGGASTFGAGGALVVWPQVAEAGRARRDAEARRRDAARVGRASTSRSPPTSCASIDALALAPSPRTVLAR